MFVTTAVVCVFGCRTIARNKVPTSHTAPMTSQYTAKADAATAITPSAIAEASARAERRLPMYRTYHFRRWSVFVTRRTSSDKLTEDAGGDPGMASSAHLAGRRRARA
jgi:hypothetical protein